MAVTYEQPKDKLAKVVNTYDRGTTAETKVLLASLRPAEVANLLESNPPKVRQVLWELLEE